MSFKSYDALFASMLDSYANASGASITVGDELYTRAVGLASAIWGLYTEASWVVSQIWPDSATQDNLVRHASQYGEILKGADYAGLLARLQSRLRSPAAGGNKTDYESWSVAFSSNGESCDSATCYPAGYGPGTCVVMVRNVSDPQPSAAFCSALRSHLLDVGPVVPAEIFVSAPSQLAIPVSITMTGGDVSEAKRLISDYMASIGIGQQVHPMAWQSFCYQAGATSAQLVSPSSSPIIPAAFQVVAISSLLINGA